MTSVMTQIMYLTELGSPAMNQGWVPFLEFHKKDSGIFLAFFHLLSKNIRIHKKKFFFQKKREGPTPKTQNNTQQREKRERTHPSQDKSSLKRTTLVVVAFLSPRKTHLYYHFDLLGV